MILPIHSLATPNHVLRQIARPLTLEEIRSQSALINDMTETMRAAPGVGLAAPQIGRSIQLAVIEDPAERLQSLGEQILIERNRRPVNLHVLINPEIIEKSGEMNYFFEGCLSVCGCVRVTPRYNFVTVRYLDETGMQKEIAADGWYARILQHEIDHLHGVVYIDVADSRTELAVDDAFRTKWMYASKEEIFDFYQRQMG